VLAALLVTGICVGILAGLLGIGGGVVAVPVLLEVYTLAGVDADLSAHLAIGTAQAAILLSSIAAALTHARAGTVNRELVAAWLPPMAIGAAAGLLLARSMPAEVLTAIFAGIAFLLGARMLAGDRLVLAHALPPPPLGWVAPAMIGLLAGGLGVGAGTLSSPVLMMLSFPLLRAIGAGAMFNLAVGLLGTAGFIAIGLDQPGLPSDAFGYVSLIGTALLSLPAIAAAPPAARLALRVPVPLLRRLFALCLFAIAARLCWRLIG
jgi:uncharacterized membrane protein YfcA